MARRRGRLTRIERRERRFRQRKQGITRPEGVDPEAVMRVLRVPPELAGTRLDRFVQSQLRATSRTHSQRIIDTCAYSPEGAPLKKNRRVQADERIVLWRPSWEELAPDDVEISVLYEDEALLAVDKPAQVPVHPTARFHKSTVTAMLERERPGEHLSLIHRLDRETSGVLLLAKTRGADRAVKIQFEKRRDVIKRYQALTWGQPDWERHTCELALEPDEDGPYRVKMRVASGSAGLPSATTFEVLARAARPDGRRYAKLGCTLHTGRQHQIRVHLAALGLPVVGDKLYGPDDGLFARGADGELTEEDQQVLEMDRQALHASSLEIDHPVSGARLCVEAPLPEDMRHFWRALQEEE